MPQRDAAVAGVSGAYRTALGGAMSNHDDDGASEAGVLRDLHRQPHLFLKLAQNALTVADSLRNNYFKNTASFVTALRRAIAMHEKGHRSECILGTHDVSGSTWTE